MQCVHSGTRKTERMRWGSTHTVDQPAECERFAEPWPSLSPMPSTPDQWSGIDRTPAARTSSQRFTNVFDDRGEWFHLDYLPRLGSDTRLNQFRNNGVEKSVGFASCDPEERVRTSAPANVSLN